MTIALIIPNWPAPANLVAYTTTRQGGVSQGAYHSLNLSTAVGDEPDAVWENRRLVQQLRPLPGDWIFPNQVHGTRCLILDGQSPTDITADAAYSRTPGSICSILTADCLPLLVCTKAGDEIAAIHAGWRGLAAGVIEASLAHFHSEPTQLLVWLGPAIGPQAFIVEEPVRRRFIAQQPSAAIAFSALGKANYHANLYQLARLRLQAIGVPNQQIYGGDYCTWSDSTRFFSYRRDETTGRMVSVIAMESKIA
ncbi:MAG: peptidoglycan editing factor PgeF [Candidatus Symbiodolus clandestinus]